MNKKRVLVSCACVVKFGKGKPKWFIVKQNEESGWEIPKIVVRKTESSVRAALRMMGEQGGMKTKVIEEAGRAGGITTVNGKTLPQRHLYYFMIHKADSGESIGFKEYDWFEYAKAVRKLPSKRERQMLKAARKEYRKWRKERKRKREEAKKAKKK